MHRALQDELPEDDFSGIYDPGVISMDSHHFGYTDVSHASSTTVNEFDRLSPVQMSTAVPDRTSAEDIGRAKRTPRSPTTVSEVVLLASFLCIILSLAERCACSELYV